MDSTDPTGTDDPNKTKPTSFWDDVSKDTNAATDAASRATKWVGDTLFPSTDTPSPNQSPAGQDNTDFYRGIGQQRAGYQAPAAQQLVEGSAPSGPSGGGTDPNTYVDPTGRDAQRRAMGLEETAANGAAPSVAEQLGRKYADEGAATQLGMAATLQGNNPGAAQRAGLAGAQDVYAKTAADAAATRANEMATARQNFATTATADRGQTQDLAKANQDAQQRQEALNNQFYLGLTDAQQRAQQAALDAEKLKTQNDVNAKAGNAGTLGKMFGAGGQLLAAL